MGKTKGKKFVGVAVAVCMVCCMSVYSISAAPKIKSRSVALNADQVTAGTGDVITLDAVMKPANSTDTIKWTSSNKSAATVNKYGVVTAVGEGKATITAKTSSRKKAQCEVTVKDYLTKEEAFKLVSQKCLTEEGIKSLIRQNTLSEADVRRILSEDAGGSGDAGWQEGAELSVLSDANLPASANGRTITRIAVKKYHYDGQWNGVFQKYKYVVEIEGTRDESSCDKEKYETVILQFTRRDGKAGSDARYYIFPEENVQNKEDYNTCVNYSESNGKFVYTAEQYNMYADFDEYFVSSMEAEYFD